MATVLMLDVFDMLRMLSFNFQHPGNGSGT
jgi:hypothetical protein